MLGFPLGILSAAGAGVAAGDYELIETEILTAAVSSITFSSLATHASTYKHLQIRAVARTVRTDVTVDALNIRFNGDTAANYSRHGLQGTTFTGTVISGGVANETFASGPTTASATSGTSVFGAGVVEILDPFSTSKFKTTKTLSGVSGGDGVIQLASGNHRNLTAVTSITLSAQSAANLAIGSRFSLYGIKG